MVETVSNRRRWGTAAAGLGLALALAACQAPKAGPVDFNKTYAITPVATTYMMETRFQGGTGELDARDNRRLERFVRQYHSRGRSAVTIATTPDNAGLEAQSHLAALRRQLANAGIGPDSVEVKPGAAPLGHGNTLLLSFRGYDIKVPECGDWEGTTGYNPTNLPQTNFGCSYQRNVGLMLADPGDLLMSEGDSYYDPIRSGVILGKYRNGEATPASLPATEESGFKE